MAKKKTETLEAEVSEVVTPAVEGEGTPRKISTELVDFHFVEDVESLAKDFTALAKTMRKYSQGFEKTYRDFSNGRWWQSLEIPPTFEDEMQASSFREDATEWMDSMLSFINKLFWGMYKSDFYKKFLALQKTYPERFPLEDDEDSDVKVRFENGVLYVKTPPVFHNFKHTFCANGKKIHKNYGGFYAYKLAHIMQNYCDECDTFGDRNVNILAVYDQKEKFIPDTHNLDFKMLVDAITNEMLGGDSWYCCSISMASMTSKVLKPGMYFTVTNGFAKTPEFNENLEKLTELFGKNQPQA